MELPLWIYFVFAGIVFSGVMTLLSAKSENEVDKKFIEKEGEIYMQRMEEERQKKRMVQ